MHLSLVKPCLFQTFVKKIINDKENCEQFADVSQSNEVNSDKSLNSYQIQNVPGDGNCFFHCLSLKLFGD